jgi:flagellar hook-associated protein 2
LTAFRPTFNVGGLASGLDTNAIIEQLMAIERNPKVRLQQRQAVEEARQNALRDVLTRVSNLKTAAAGLRDATIWGDTQTVESSDPTRITATRVSGAAPGAYSLTITQLARAHQVMQGSGVTQAAADDMLQIQVGSGASVGVAIAAGDTLEAIAAKINSTSDVPVYASVVNSKLVLSGKTTGAASTISVTSTGTLASDLAFATSLTAQDAQYTLEGVARTSASNTITDAIVGLSLTLKAQTTGPVAITVGAPGADTEKIEEKVKAFVDQYNSVVDFIRSKLAEKKVANPATDDDRAKGVLAGDRQLVQLLSSLRQSVSDLVGGRPTDLDQLSEIGISTGASNAGGTTSADSIAGKLVLDSAKLAERLAARFADVKALLHNATGDASTEGFAQRVDRLLEPITAASTGILSQRISSQQSLIDLLKKRQADLDVRLAQKEVALRRQFSALEAALSQLQSQNDFVSARLAALSTQSG